MSKGDMFAKNHVQYATVFALAVVTPIATALVTTGLHYCSYHSNHSALTNITKSQHAQNSCSASVVMTRFLPFPHSMPRMTSLHWLSA